MIVIPAIDLRDGACAQLVQSSAAGPGAPRHPAEVAREWYQHGFQRIHVVDRDAATGRGANRALVRAVLHDAGVPVQVGGGVRDVDRLEELLDDGADWIVIGTRAIEDPDWLADVASRHPGRVIVAADVRDRRVVTQGWSRTLTEHISDVVDELNPLPLAALLVTAVHREGQPGGTDLPLMEDVAEASRFPVFAAGGIASVEDLRALEHRGLAGAVVSMPLYDGAIDAHAVVQEFG